MALVGGSAGTLSATCPTTSIGAAAGVAELATHQGAAVRLPARTHARRCPPVGGESRRAPARKLPWGWGAREAGKESRDVQKAAGAEEEAAEEEEEGEGEREGEHCKAMRSR